MYSTGWVQCLVAFPIDISWARVGTYEFRFVGSYLILHFVHEKASRGCEPGRELPALLSRWLSQVPLFPYLFPPGAIFAYKSAIDIDGNAIFANNSALEDGGKT